MTRSWTRLFVSIAAGACTVLSTAAAWAQPSAPTGLTVVPVKGQGTLAGDTYFTAFKKPLSFEITGTSKTAVVRVYAGDAIIAEGKGKNGVTKLKSLKTFAPVDGLSPLTASQIEEGVEGPRSGVLLKLNVDRTPPDAPTAPDLAAESDSGVSSQDNVTNKTELKFTGVAEPLSTVRLAIKGKAQKNVFATANDSGAYTLTLPKAKAGVLQQFSVVQEDRAGNISPVGAFLEVSVLLKPPTAPKNLRIVEADAEPGSGGRSTRKLRPTIAGLAVPGAMVSIRINDAAAGEAVADAAGVFGFTPQADLDYGSASIAARQTDPVGNLSPSALLAISVIIDNAAPAPGSEGAVLVEDFNDNSRSALWRELEPSDEAIEVAERNARLEFNLKRRIGKRAEAGFVADGWAISLQQDFRLRLNWRLNSAGTNVSDIGVGLALVMDGSTTTGGIYDGVRYSAAGGEDGAVFALQSAFDGEPAENSSSERRTATGTFYVWYSATEDRIRLSRVGFSDPTPRVINGARAASGVNSAAVFLSAWTDGDAPGVSGANAYIDNFVLLEGQTVQTRLPAEGGAGVAVRADDFDDNTRAGFWREYQRNSQYADAVELGKRLQLRFATNPGFVDGLAGYFSNGWSLDLNSDFRARVDWRFPAVAISTQGGVGLTFSVLSDGSVENGTIREGLSLFAGSDKDSAFTSFSHRVNNAEAAKARVDRTDSLGAFYLRYETATNRLYYSQKGYNDNNAPFVTGLRGQNRTRAIFFLGGYSAGVAPGTNEGFSWYDNFSVDQGVLINQGLPALAASSDSSGSGLMIGAPNLALPADVNGDGLVDSADVAIVTAAVGQKGEGLRTDLDADGEVTANDVRMVIESFGLKSE